MANLVGRVTRRWAWSETPPMHLGIIPFCLKFPHSNHRIGAHACTNHTVPYGTALWGGDRGRDKVGFAPPSEPDCQISWIKCGQPHLIHYVAFPLMWR